MTKQSVSPDMRQVQDVMRRAVRDEIAKKARLGQYVVINRDGKPCRIPAAEALLEIREEDSAYGQGRDLPPPGPGEGDTVRGQDRADG
jgi:hypothetical protein